MGIKNKKVSNKRRKRGIKSDRGMREGAKEKNIGKVKETVRKSETKKKEKRRNIQRKKRKEEY